MTLSSILIKSGLVTGPLPSTSNTSNSSMGVSKNFLLGLPQFKGDETFLLFGRVLHEHLQYLENEKFRAKDFDSLKDYEQLWILGICKVARENSVVRRLLTKSARENKVYTEIDGVRIALILDVEQEGSNTGIDWKSSSCPTLSDFIKKALLYDYIRQGLLYKKARNLKHFYFIGLQKKPPHQVYIMDIKKHEAELFYANQELKFLIYFYKHYGKIILEQTTKQNNDMAKVITHGKEALQQIAAHYKIVKASAKEHSKKVKEHNKLISNFPKKEIPLYAEKLDKFKI